MNSAPTILVVEDNDDDVFLLRRALRAMEAPLQLAVAADGQQAVDYLAGTGSYADRARHPAPALVLLDLKLPYLHGFEVLAWIRSQPELRALPVLILTSSGEQRDVEQAARLGVRSYHVKPPKPSLLGEVAQILEGASLPAR